MTPHEAVFDLTVKMQIEGYEHDQRTEKDKGTQTASRYRPRETYEGSNATANPYGQQQDAS